MKYVCPVCLLRLFCPACRVCPDCSVYPDDHDDHDVHDYHNDPVYVGIELQGQLRMCEQFQIIKR